MLFNSTTFIFGFLPITLLVYFCLRHYHHRAALAWLVSASLFFYGWWEPVYLVLLGSSIAVNFILGRALSSASHQRAVLTAGISFNLALLGYFKYFHFLSENVNALTGSDFAASQIILPLAISFFTFQQIAYLVDAYRGGVRQYSLLEYTLFVTFFPQLIAGPIVHHNDIIPQFSASKLPRFSSHNLSIGITLFAIGLAKKVLIADYCALHANPVFDAAAAGESLSFGQAWQGALAYSLQLYFDFSGYADMAIGLGRMIGIQLPDNFQSPYKAHNIIEFWRRWHMTLSRFLREHLYIPLGGNQRGSKFVNLFITMLLGGLWHGAAWSFVIWGGLHGLYLIINHAWQRFRQQRLGHDVNQSSRAARLISQLATFVFVTIAWVFFRADSLPAATQMLASMGQISQLLSVQISGGTSLILVGIFALAMLAPNSKQVSTFYSRHLASTANSSFIHPALALPISILLLCSIKVILTVNESEFLYFNF